jgi:hypothetical protein
VAHNEFSVVIAIDPRDHWMYPARNTYFCGVIKYFIFLIVDVHDRGPICFYHQRRKSLEKKMVSCHPVA